MRLFVDNLCNVDFSYLCPERGLVGETWLASVVLEGELDNQGMICDFGIVKKNIRHWLDKTIDHCLLVPEKNNRIHTEDKDQQRLVTLSGEFECMAPSQAICLIPAESIAPKNVAAWSEVQLKSLFGEAVEGITISFEPESIAGPYYHYSHGLKKHDGNCQRIAHGHRSKLEIWRNGQLCQQSMSVWCGRWRDIYIATREDCVSDENGLLKFEYQSHQGLFRLTLPKAQCYFVDTDTTVENIAQHMLDVLQQHYPHDEFVVKAYEGIGKGAIAKGRPPLKL